jgi:DNA-binding response OmpR family regulator
MDHPRLLDGCWILVVQRSRHIARALASMLESKGAQVVLARVARRDLADLPRLAAAVLNGHSHELCKLLEARKTPFVVYTALDQSECQFTTRTKVIQKHVPVTEVVAAVEELFLT